MIPAVCPAHEVRAGRRADSEAATGPRTGAVGGRCSIRAGREDRRDRRGVTGGEVAAGLARGRPGDAAFEGTGVDRAAVARAMGTAGARTTARPAGARLGRGP